MNTSTGCNILQEINFYYFCSQYYFHQTLTPHLNGFKRKHKIKQTVKLILPQNHENLRITLQVI